MKRRDLLKLFALSPIAAVVGYTDSIYATAENTRYSVASDPRLKQELTYEDIEAVKRAFMEADVPEPRHIWISEKGAEMLKQYG